MERRQGNVQKKKRNARVELLFRLLNLVLFLDAAAFVVAKSPLCNSQSNSVW